MAARSLNVDLEAPRGRPLSFAEAHGRRGPTSGALDVRRGATRREVDTFIRLPWALYDGFPNWVPPLLSERRPHLDRRADAFFEHAEAQYFLAWRKDRPVGGISAHIDHRFKDVHISRWGVFGLFECLHDAEGRSLFSPDGIEVERELLDFSTLDRGGERLLEGLIAPPGCSGSTCQDVASQHPKRTQSQDQPPDLRMENRAVMLGKSPAHLGSGSEAPVGMLCICRRRHLVSIGISVVVLCPLPPPYPGESASHRRLPETCGRWFAP